MAIATLLSLAHPCYAQEVEELVQEGKQWDMAVSYNTEVRPDSSYVLTLQGDTVINGIVYKRLMQDGRYRATLRQEGKKVYVVRSYGEREELLYDFALEVGEYFGDEQNPHLLKVQKVDLISVNGKPARRLQLLNGDIDPWWESQEGGARRSRPLYNMSTCWVEGIGSLFGPDLASNNAIAPTTDYTERCLYDDTVIFTWDDFMTSTGVDQPVCHSKDSRQSKTYDLTGRERMSYPRRGVYIQNGEKHVK